MLSTSVQVMTTRLVSLAQAVLILQLQLLLLEAQHYVLDVTKYKDLRTNHPSTSASSTDNTSSILWQHYELALPHEEWLSWSAPKPDATVPADCPAWLLEYADFHKRMRGQPDAKYIVNSCPDRFKCYHGLGDRLRGLLPTVQLAAAHKRVLLIDWDYPHPLEAFFEPNLINWLVTDDLKPVVANATEIHMARANLTHHNHEGPMELVRTWAVDTNRMPYRPGKHERVHFNVTWLLRVSWHAHCIFQHLFKPSARLIEATDKVQMELLGSTDKPFVAAHLRMGQLVGEDFDIPRGWDHFQGLLAAYRCSAARDAALHGDGGFLGNSPAVESAPRSVFDSSASRKQYMISQTRQEMHTGVQQGRPRMIWLTDHSQLRHMIGKQMLRGVTGPNYNAHHYSYSQDLKDGQDTEAITMSVFVDLMLLSRARCMIWSKSGFSRFAMAYGWTPCTVLLEVCIKEMALNGPM